MLSFLVFTLCKSFLPKVKLREPQFPGTTQTKVSREQRILGNLRKKAISCLHRMVTNTIFILPQVGQHRFLIKLCEDDILHASAHRPIGRSQFRILHSP
jgi:hypothetical protein